MEALEKLDALRKFVTDHSARGTCRCGRCIDHPGEDQQPADHTVDLVFFEVAAKGDPIAVDFRRLIEEASEGEFCELNPWDGGEHSYIQVGAWIGDQGLALMFMGLGSLLGLWSIMTPKMLGLPDELVQEMAGKGMVTIMPPV